MVLCNLHCPFLKIVFWGLVLSPAQVTRVAWWMAHYMGPTPKRHFAYSNSAAVGRLDRGVLSGWKKRENKVKTAVAYVDKQGKKRYKGTPALRSTEMLEERL